MSDKLNILGNILIVFIVIIILKTYLDGYSYKLSCVISNVDGNKYCVRSSSKVQESADLLARVTEKMKKLVKYMDDKYPKRENVNRLVDGFNPKKITETLPTDELTAYSENKGEKLAFCLRKNKNGANMIDENTLTFVTIHELSHIMTKSVGHTSEFWENFKFLLINAKDANIHNPENYKENPVTYCGMEIHDNPYYDI
jgi:hypothetical protein